MFDILWAAEVSRNLERIWQRVNDRDAVLRALWHHEDALKDDPKNTGEEWADEQRIAFDGPLTILFEILSAANRVWVHAVWQIRQV